MPKDNIERAIARGSGAAADGETFEHITYEGYGPAGVAVFVDALTDNRNRTASEVRHVFAKSEGSLGESGSVAWLFERTGLLLVPADGVDEDELTLAAADGGADDVSQDGSVFEITCPAENVGDVRRALEQAAFVVESAQITMLPKTSVTVEDEPAARRIVRLMEELEELDDVQDVYANFDIPEQVLEAATT
jgi:YebC/PmpR family DNA-binding regulatory protein